MFISYFAEKKTFTGCFAEFLFQKPFCFFLRSTKWNESKHGVRYGTSGSWSWNEGKTFFRVQGIYRTAISVFLMSIIFPNYLPI